MQTALDRQSVKAFRHGMNGTATSHRTTNARPDDVDDSETTAMPAGSLRVRRLTALEKGKGKMNHQSDSTYHPGFDGASDAQLVEEFNNAIAAGTALEQNSLNNMGLNPSDQDLSADNSAAPQGQLHHLATANKQPSPAARQFSFTTKAADERLDVISRAAPVTANERQRLSSGYEAEDESLDTATLGDDGSGSISTGSRMSSTSSVSRRGWRHADAELHVPPGGLSQTSLRGGHVARPRAEITPMGKFGQMGQKWQSGVVGSTPELGGVRVKEPVHGMPSQRLRKKKGSVGEMARPACFDGAACEEMVRVSELSVPRKRPFSDQRGSREGDQIDDAAEARGKWVEDEFGEYYWVEDEIAMRRYRGMRGSEDSGYVTGQAEWDEGEGEGEGDGEWEDAREVFTLDDLPSARFKGGSLRGKRE
ncbi:MAG: hypothetical protein OHK93_008303 [Ramalina farinacea]|uniref:Uncharacterized protein n=1 Tax=Ramalina farinacea TaxID=258253 RepID=A0AA43QQ34_9LECA|nr:hypothetical protein [Ramalina farinacea]